jgi:hypothetical protein
MRCLDAWQFGTEYALFSGLGSARCEAHGQYLSCERDFRGQLEAAPDQGTQEVRSEHRGVESTCYRQCRHSVVEIPISCFL